MRNFLIAALTRSLASSTALLGRPTIVNLGKPLSRYINFNSNKISLNSNNRSCQNFNRHKRSIIM